MRVTMFGLVCVLIGGVGFAQPTVMIDDLTGTEVREAIAQGKTTVIIYVGGLHENTYQTQTTEYVGPDVDAVAINKHTLVALYQARRIAEELGNALAYYPLPYTPAGSHGRIPDFPVTRSHPPASWPSAANSSICRTYRKTAGEESRRRSPVANRWMPSSFLQNWAES